jgi:hypothetical protein
MQRKYNETFLISAKAFQYALIDNSCGCGLFLPKREIMRFNVKCFSSHSYFLFIVLPTLFSRFGIRGLFIIGFLRRSALGIGWLPYMDMIYD